MPVFNAEKYVEAAIKSILRQTMSDFELIIIDDASNDKSNEIITSINDSRIRVYTNQKNIKVSNTLNKALHLARGEYIARMDADDIAYPNRLHIQSSFLDRNKDYILVASEVETFSDSPQITFDSLVEHQKWWNQGYTDEEIKQFLILGNCLNHPSIMYKKEEVLKVGGYRDSYNFAEDYDLFIRLGDMGKFFKIPIPLLKYRIHSNQVSVLYKSEQRCLDAKIKANLLMNRYVTSNDKILIWGASLGGKLIAKELLKRNVNIVGFIDKNKKLIKREILGINVLGDENSIQKKSYDFIVIATVPGREFATKYLNEQGLQYGKDYIPVW